MIEKPTRIGAQLVGVAFDDQIIRINQWQHRFRRQCALLSGRGAWSSPSRSVRVCTRTSIVDDRRSVLQSQPARASLFALTPVYFGLSRICARTSRHLQKTFGSGHVITLSRTAVSRRLGPANHANNRMRRQNLASKSRQSGFADTARPIV